jgi:hypothetical protein
MTVMKTLIVFAIILLSRLLERMENGKERDSGTENEKLLY